MTSQRDLPRDIGGFIRDLRHNARISLRQLAQQAGVSNPYLSQIERGLRKPSAEVLAQLAGALRVSTPMMYLRAGLLDSREGQDVLAAIAADPDLTVPQKQSLTQIYETFRRENTRAAEEAGAIRIPVSEPAHEHPAEPVADRPPAGGTAGTEPAAQPPAVDQSPAQHPSVQAGEPEPARRHRRPATQPTRRAGAARTDTSGRARSSRTDAAGTATTDEE